MKTLLFVLFFPAVCYSQVSVSYSPTSIDFWGITPQTQKLSIDLYYGKLVYVSRDTVLLDKRRQPANTKNFGAGGFLPVARSKYFDFNFGVLYFVKPVPTTNGKRFNFIFEGFLKIPVNFVDIGISYSHISNGYTGRINPGLDNLSLKIGVTL